jgi:hypothetical protein
MSASQPKATNAAKPKAKQIGDWRGETLARMRSLILAADPEITEDVKWRKPSNDMASIPVWSRHGIICTGETYKNYVKLTFAQGAKLADPKRLFNASLEGGTRRAIDIHEGDEVDAAAFQTLIQAAVAQNDPAAKQPSAKQASTKSNSGDAKSSAGKPSKMPKQSDVVLLSGGNPQIAKADGDAPVQAYIAAMPGWKSDLGRQLDALIVKNAPKVNKAVKWNSPFYGIEGQGWFLSFHVFAKYVKVTFFAGTSLKPVPPGGTPKSKEARWLDIHEDDELDEKQMAAWVKQAAKLPGWVP